jgi:spermidine/putrescine transport system substrate-binding protein
MTRPLRLLGWPDYTLDEVHRRFEERTGVAVEYENFDQNEEAFLRLRRDPGAFDVVFADGLWPARYAAEGLVEGLDPAEFESWDGVHAAIRDFCLQRAWTVDGGRTAAYPANWALRGILWDPTRVDEPIASWSDLWRDDLAGRVWINSQGSEIVAEVAISLGIDPAEVYRLAPDDLERVAERMETLGASLGGVWMVWPDLRAAFAEHGAAAAEVHTVHLAGNLRDELGMECVATVPAKGTIGWVDGAMVVRDSPLRAEAVRFIDYLFSPEGIVLQWEESDGYAPASVAGLDALRATGRWPEKVAGIAAEDPADVLGSVLYRPPADLDGYLGAWERLLEAAGSRAPEAAWGGVRAGAAEPR